MGAKRAVPEQGSVRKTILKQSHVMSKLSLVKEMWGFLKVRKKWWLAPIVICLLLLGALVIFAQSSAVAPFIYTLF